MLTQPPPTGPKLPTMEERIAQSHRNAAGLVEGCEKRYAAGEKVALLEAINWCAGSGIPIPEWAAKAFAAAYRSTIWNFEHRSWDEVFGMPHRARRLHDRRVEHELSERVYRRVLQMRAQRRRASENKHTMPAVTRFKALDIDPMVAKEFSISEASVKRYYSRRKRWWAEAWADGAARLKTVQKIEK